jgi:hypothetical protein
LSESTVKIEDDCWIAQSVVVSPGVYIGRGAVVGANTVVTHDIGPYEIHGGTPNKKIGVRLDFAPPSSIEARDDGALPYFYRGFRLRQEALERSRKQGFIEARDKACLVLSPGAKAQVRLAGINLDPNRNLHLGFRVNGVKVPARTIPPGKFDVTIDPTGGTPEKAAVPAVLRHLTYIEIEATEPTVRYGIAAATMEAKHD